MASLRLVRLSPRCWIQALTIRLAALALLTGLAPLDPGLFAQPVYRVDYETEEQYERGLDLLYGREGETNERKAARALKSAASKGHERAQNLLGMLYLEGTGVHKSQKQSAFWFLRSAEQGYVPGMYNAAVAYLSGRGVEQDFSEAYRLLKEVADPEKPHAVAPEDFAFFKNIRSAAF